MSAPVSERERREVAELERRQAAKVRRTAPITQLILIVLLVLVGLTTAIDLRRLNTPGGTALSWAEAATFGDCDRYAELSVSPAATPERRPSGEVCSTLRAQTQANRESQSTITVRLIGSRDGAATVDVERDGQPTRRAEIALVRRDGHWRVVLDGNACNPIGCA